ncbi:MAG TPA: hypothetical protein VGZ32_18015 [Actinocrinis sp.]|uniref:hypothetical protein n=1 Tax=Actinocrinis sp. TaxID=1920516 RepID=UPI002DDCDD20|nr:hypothetical protein [Actinocrinis sp.]HEV3172252.1 hypothetical protein [Actinocrinis sp.]
MAKRSVSRRVSSAENSANETRTSRAAGLLRADPPSPLSRSLPDPAEPADPERERRIRRARFLAELAEARELRKRVAPRRARSAELHARLFRTFRY